MTATDAEKLAQIRALCDEAVEWQEVDPPMVLVQDVRTILDAAPANATPPQGIDRDADADAAWQAYKEREWHGWDSLQPDLHEAFLAGWVARPVRPVEGVTLAREEATWLVTYVRNCEQVARDFGPESTGGRDASWFAALAARLEATQ